MLRLSRSWMVRRVLQSPEQRNDGEVAESEKYEVRESDMTASANTDNGGHDEVRNREIVVHGVRKAEIENGLGKDKQIENYRRREPSPTLKGAFPRRLGMGWVFAFVHRMRGVTPTDLKGSDCPARRAGCAGEGGGAVRCSADGLGLFWRFEVIGISVE